MDLCTDATKYGSIIPQSAAREVCNICLPANEVIKIGYMIMGKNPEHAFKILTPLLSNYKKLIPIKQIEDWLSGNPDNQVIDNIIYGLFLCKRFDILKKFGLDIWKVWDYFKTLLGSSNYLPDLWLQKIHLLCDRLTTEQCHQMSMALTKKPRTLLAHSMEVQFLLWQASGVLSSENDEKLSTFLLSINLHTFWRTDVVTTITTMMKGFRNFFNDIDKDIKPPKVAQTKENLLEYYPMNNPGLCVILNMEHFYKSTNNQPDNDDPLPERTGTDVDVTNLKECFTQFGYKVKVHNNQSRSNVKSLTQYYAQLDHGNYDSFILCVLSHGEKGYIMGSDSDRVHIRTELLLPFFGTNSQTLAGKPKMFFIQACQGKDYSLGVKSQEKIVTQADDIQQDSPVTVNDADLLVFLAATPDKVAFRSKSKGSFFVSDLCSTLNMYGATHDLGRLLTHVKYKVSCHQFSPVTEIRQICITHDTLRKLVKFNKCRKEYV